MLLIVISVTAVEPRSIITKIALQCLYLGCSALFYSESNLGNPRGDLPQPFLCVCEVHGETGSVFTEVSWSLAPSSCTGAIGFYAFLSLVSLLAQMMPAGPRVKSQIQFFDPSVRLMSTLCFQIRIVGSSPRVTFPIQIPHCRFRFLKVKLHFLLPG